MAFILPASKYTTVEQAPTPTDPRVTLRQLPERVQVQVSRVHGSDALITAHRARGCLSWENQRRLCSVLGVARDTCLRRVSQPTATIAIAPVQAVRTFTWSFKPEAAKSQLQLLLADLAKDEWTVVKRADGEAEWQAAGYNPPFTLPFMKTNEVLVSVQPRA